jgi:hypothetical protein
MGAPFVDAGRSSHLKSECESDCEPEYQVSIDPNDLMTLEGL